MVITLRAWSILDRSEGWIALSLQSRERDGPPYHRERDRLNAEAKPAMSQIEGGESGGAGRKERQAESKGKRP